MRIGDGVEEGAVVQHVPHLSAPRLPKRHKLRHGRRDGRRVGVVGARAGVLRGRHARRGPDQRHARLQEFRGGLSGGHALPPLRPARVQRHQVRRGVRPPHRHQTREALPEHGRALRSVASIRDAVDERSEPHG